MADHILNLAHNVRDKVSDIHDKLANNVRDKVSNVHDKLAHLTSSLVNFHRTEGRRVRSFYLNELDRETREIVRRSLSTTYHSDKSIILIGNFRDRTPVTLRRFGSENLYLSSLSDSTSLIEHEIMKMYDRKINHPNVADLLGYCCWRDRIMLVYEYVENHTLADMLSSHPTIKLSWSVRASICRQVACGLAYLHRDCHPKIIHGDVKPSTVLIDHNFNPKTIPIIAASNVDLHGPGFFSRKKDVYSFGIFVLEVFCGKTIDKINLVKWVERDMFYEIFDPTLSDFPESKVIRFIKLAFHCTRENPNRRPKIMDVLREIESITGYQEPSTSNSGGIEVENPSPVVADPTENNVGFLPQKVNIMRPVKGTVEKCLQAFRNGEPKIISLQGKRGSGKTTVLKTLLHHPDTKAMFHIIIHVKVSRICSQEVLQNEIIRQLSLNVEETNSEAETLDAISKAFVSKKVLLLLDDACKDVNLTRAVISNIFTKNTCWSVLASSLSLEVSHNFGTDTKIEIEVLSDIEAWDLFRFLVGDVINRPNIVSLARSVAKECQGLPPIISAVGSALKAETNDVNWEDALKYLQLSDGSSSSIQTDFSPHIKFCYDRLKSREVKSLFLYIALFMEDKEIDTSMLMECFINEGFLGGKTVRSYKKAHDIVQNLVNSSLLQAYNDRMVRMDTVIRDSALTILSKDVEGYNQILVGSNLRRSLTRKSEDVDAGELNQFVSVCRNIFKAGAQLKEPPSLEEWEQADMIFLMNNEFSSLPSNPECSNLMGLFLQNNSNLRVIPTSFFHGMLTLKILNLSKTRINALPDSHSMLTNLQVLLLRDCERLFVLPPSIGLHKLLEVLDLQGTEINQLPESIGELKSLKEFHVSLYGSTYETEYNSLPHKLIPDGIISSLDLIELGIFVHPGDRRWTSIASDITKEVSSLKLFTLFFHFPELEDLELYVKRSKSWKDGDVTTFNFIVGHDVKRIASVVSHDAEAMFSGSERCLRLVNGECITDTIAGVLRKATALYLDHHLRICNLSELGIENMESLKICILSDCPELRGLADTQNQDNTFFPNLEYLSFNNLWALERTWIDQVVKGGLARLRVLSVSSCPQLTYVLSNSMLGELPCLEELVVENCISLTEIVIGDELMEEDVFFDATDMDDANVTQQQTTIVDSSPVLGNLKVLKLHYLPELRGIWKAQWPPVEYISFHKCPNIKDLRMKADDDMHIEEITADLAWWGELHWDDSELCTRLQQNVNQINIHDF